MPSSICTYILPEKKRRCRLATKQNAPFCGVHSQSNATLPCPQCGTILPDPLSLPRHQTRCPVSKRLAATQAQPWYAPSINLPPPPSGTTPLSNPPDLKPLLETIVATIPTPKPNSPSLQESATLRDIWSDPRISTVKMEPKHYPQIETLSAIVLQHAPHSETPLAIIELGAGRAYTSMFLTHVAKLRGSRPSVVVIDKSPTRLKADRSMRHWVSDGSIRSFRRLTVDLADVDLGALEEPSGARVFIVGKHVCGSALDVSLVAASALAGRNGSRGIRMVFAVCCRRLCQWGTLGCRAVLEEWGFDERVFEELRRVANWGLDASHEGDMAEMGRMARLVLDWARVVWLRRLGWDAQLSIYTDASPENTCIHAVWKGNDRDSTSEIFNG